MNASSNSLNTRQLTYILEQKCILYIYLYIKLKIKTTACKRIETSTVFIYIERESIEHNYLANQYITINCGQNTLQITLYVELYYLKSVRRYNSHL